MRSYRCSNLYPAGTKKPSGHGSITIRRALTWHYRKMHPCVEQSNGLVPLSLFRSWLGCITNTSGYDFRKGQLPTIGFPVGRRLDDLVLVPENGRSRIILTREGAGGRYQAYRGRHHFRTLRAGIASRRGHVDDALLRKPAFGSPGSLSIRKKWHRPARKKRWRDSSLLFQRRGASD